MDIQKTKPYNKNTEFKVKIEYLYEAGSDHVGDNLTQMVCNNLTEFTILYILQKRCVSTLDHHLGFLQMFFLFLMTVNFLRHFDILVQTFLFSL